MKTYLVYERSTGELRYTYNSETPVEWNEYPFSLYDHQETDYVEPGTTSPEPTISGEPLTKLQFLRKFTQEERIAMMAAADQSYAVKDYMHLLELAEEVYLNDPYTIAGLQTMEAAGLIGPGRATEILYG